MSATASMDDSRMQRMAEAAEWLQRMQAGSGDEQVVESWLDWCQRDPLNQQAFDELAAVWELSGQLDAAPPAQPTLKRSRPGRRYALAASLGALIITALTGVWWIRQPALHDVVVKEFASPTGANTTTTLADGSVLELGGGTRVTVEIGPHSRQVKLHEGELYVTVQKDPARPFSVDAGRLEAIATGTAFNVLLTEGRTTVTVAEGSVDALYEGQATATPNVRVTPNQQLVYSHASHSVEVRQLDPRDLVAGWRKGQLPYKNEPLAEIAATLNRYATRRIVIEDAQVAGMGYSGTISIDNIGGWLKGLPDIFPVTVVQLADGRQLIRPQPGATAD